MLDPVTWKCGSGKVVQTEEIAAEELLPGKLRLIDQTELPEKLVYVEIDSTEDLRDAIKRLVVRGAPAIGCAASLGLAAVCQYSDADSVQSFIGEIEKKAKTIGGSRPTAVNLSWALHRSVAKAKEYAATGSPVAEIKKALVTEGLGILKEDISMCRAIGRNGVSLFSRGTTVLTHCNAGALATGDYGTALSPIYAAHEKGLEPRVFSDETRPLLQGSRLTAWELQRSGVDVTTICDNMAAQVMKEGKIDFVIVGSDRVAANGDAANKIGTYGLAVLADYHKIPFYVCIPYSTIDPDIPQGDLIPIEQRDPDEVRRGFGKLTAPPDIPVYSPAFDVTPNNLITGIITERGILRKPYDTAIREFLKE